MGHPAAAFAYNNVQVVATAGAETRDPRRSIPKAVKATFWVRPEPGGFLVPSLYT